MGSFKEALIEKGGLPAEIWHDGDPVMVAPEQAWPKHHKHTCDAGYTSGWVGTIRAYETTIAPIPGRHWRECDGCYDKHVQRHAQQVEHELSYSPLKVMQTDDQADYNRLAAKWRQWRKRKEITVAYRAYPQEDGSYYVIHDQTDEPGDPVATNRTELVNLIKQIARTPEDRRVSSSEGWGGPWQGAKGDGRIKEARKRGENLGPVIQVWGEKQHIRKVADALDMKLNKRKRGKVEMHPQEVDERLTLAGITFYVRDDGLTWKEFLHEVRKIRGPYEAPVTMGLAADIARYRNYDPDMEAAKKRIAEREAQRIPEPAIKQPDPYLVSYGGAA